MYPESNGIERIGLAAAVEQAVDGVAITAVDGKIQYVNPAFTALTGYTRDEAVGQYPRILKSGLQPDSFYRDLWQTIRAGQVWHGELINRRKDGSFYHEEMRITPVHDAQGEIVNYIAIKHDVTERLAAERTKGLLAAIVENSQDAIITYAPAGNILTWNRGAETVFGYLAAEAIGRPMTMLMAPERRPYLARLTKRVLGGEAVSNDEGLCRHRDGRAVPVSVTAAPIRNSDGEVWRPSPSFTATVPSPSKRSKTELCSPRSSHRPTTRSRA